MGKKKVDRERDALIWWLLLQRQMTAVCLIKSDVHILFVCLFVLHLSEHRFWSRLACDGLHIFSVLYIHPMSTCCERGHLYFHELFIFLAPNLVNSAVTVSDPGSRSDTNVSLRAKTADSLLSTLYCETPLSADILG